MVLQVKSNVEFNNIRKLKGKTKYVELALNIEERVLTFFPDEDITISQTRKTVAQNLTNLNKSQENKT